MKRLERLRTCYIEICEERQRMKYRDRILAGKIRVQDVPLKLRRNPHIALSFYIAGFRVARGVSPERVSEELDELRSELLLLNSLDSPDHELIRCLQMLYEDKSGKLEDRRWDESHDYALWETLP